MAKLDWTIFPDPEALDPLEKEAKRKKFIAMKMRDKELEREQEALANTPVCPHCHILVTSTGECSMGCGWKVPQPRKKRKYKRKR